MPAPESATSHCHQPLEKHGKGPSVPEGSCSHAEATIEVLGVKVLKAEGALVINTAVTVAVAPTALFSFTESIATTLSRSQSGHSTLILRI
jgi:hypothetical protein